MKRRWIIVVAFGAIAVAGAAAWFAFGAAPELREQLLAELGLAAPIDGPLVAAGFIESEELAVAAELGGRIVALDVAKGDVVVVGQELLRLDAALIEAQIGVARAAVGTAEAQLAHAQAGPRDAELRQAEAALALAQRVASSVRQSLEDLQALADNPQELNAEIARARSEVAAARAAVRGATARKDAAEIGNEAFHDVQEELRKAQERWEEIPEPHRPPKPTLETQLDFHLLPNAYWQAWVALNAARARHEVAQTGLADLLRMRDNPQELNAQIDATRAEVAAAEARVARARAELAALEGGATAEELALLAAKVQQDEAGLATLQRLREKLTLAAPAGGMVLRLHVRQGELAAPGATLLTLSDLDEVTLTVFVPAPRLSEVRIGQSVAIRTDSFTDRSFEGEVVAIATQAEFAPREIEIREERLNLVFAVDIRIANPDHALKPGAYAEAHFSLERGRRAQAESTTTTGAATWLAGITPPWSAKGGELEVTAGVPREVVASGFLEGVSVRLAAEMDGQIAELAVERGDTVTAGELLLRLDAGILRAERDQAQAAHAAAEANLALARAGARDAEIAAAAAELAEAEARRAGADDAVVHAREAITSPLQLDARLNEARGRAALAEQEVEAARAALAATELEQRVYAERGGDIARAWNLRLASAEAALAEAEATLQGARAYAASLAALRADPLELRVELHRAEAEAEVAALETALRQARLDDLRAGPAPTEITIAERQVDEAAAALELFDARLGRLTVRAPLSGLVDERLVRAGETVVAGQPLLTLVDLDEVTLVIYIAQRHIGRVQIGQSASVSVVGFPEQRFTGRVAAIAGEAQFTPGEVLIEDERVSLVYAVDIAIANPSHALRPGMPAEATVRLTDP